MGDILAIVGSTKFESDTHASYVAFNFLANYVSEQLPDEVISGGASGLDTIGIQIANLLEVHYRNFLPENKRWEPDGYKARNIEIASTCTRLVCVRHFASKTYGSGWTADHAERIGKKVERFMFMPNCEIERL
jgi:hypothetical protein